jgi:hypothetical protein
MRSHRKSWSMNGWIYVECTGGLSDGSTLSSSSSNDVDSSWNICWRNSGDFKSSIEMQQCQVKRSRHSLALALLNSPIFTRQGETILNFWESPYVALGLCMPHLELYKVRLEETESPHTMGGEAWFTLYGLVSMASLVIGSPPTPHFHLYNVRECIFLQWHDNKLLLGVARVSLWKINKRLAAKTMWALIFNTPEEIPILR